MIWRRVCVFVIFCFLTACAGKDTSPDRSEKTVRLVGGKVTNVVDATSFFVDGNMLPLAQDIERRVILWGVVPSLDGASKPEAASDFLQEFLVESGRSVSCLEVSEASDGAIIATCSVSDGSLQELLVKKGLLEEDCAVTDGRYGQC